MLEIGIIFFVIGIALFIAESAESSFYRYAVIQTSDKVAYTTKKQRVVYNAVVASCLLIGFSLALFS